VSDVYGSDAYHGAPDKPIGENLTASKVREKWDHAHRAVQIQREQAALNQRFLHNKHWVYWNRGSGRLEELPRQPERVRATIARIGPDSNRLIAKLTQNVLTFEVLPDTPDDASIQASKVAESAINEICRNQDWEDIRYDHAATTWCGGVGAMCVDWDDTVGAVIGVNEQTGEEFMSGDVQLTALSIHEVAVEPGTRNAEKGRWWIRGMALPPAEVQETYDLEDLPKADARSVDSVWQGADGERGTNVPLTMVYVYYERPTGKNPGRVATIINDMVVQEMPWYFPFKDRLNLAVGIVQPIHGRWFGHTPVTDAVPVQTAMNASWSSIIEHMKQAGNARLWIPEGSVENVADLSDLPGESVEYNPINGMRPTYESPPVMPEWWIRQPGMLGDAMDDILGGHDISRGNAPTGVESGIAMSILAENDDTPVGRFGKNLSAMWGRVGSMVLALMEVRVRDQRVTSVKMPDAKIPQIIKWSGNTIAGHTTARVPEEAHSMRGRAAQSAWAMQLFDRGIIQSVTELSKVADVPNQGDILAATDPDTARALRENAFLSSGTPRTVDTIDDHANHIHHHRNFVRSERYEHLEQPIQQIIRDHLAAHELYAAQLMASQMQAASVSPMAAALPQEAPTALNQQAMADAAGLAAFAPSATTGPPGAGMGMEPAQQAQLPIQAGGGSHTMPDGTEMADAEMSEQPPSPAMGQPPTPQA
jgi:hypothetical protein